MLEDGFPWLEDDFACVSRLWESRAKRHIFFNVLEFLKHVTYVLGRKLKYQTRETYIVFSLSALDFCMGFTVHWC